MKTEQFYDTIEELIDECLEIMKAKGLAYSGKDDSFANFKRVAKNLSMSQYNVWYVYFAKHLDSLASWIREEYSDSEPITGRIKDLINYLFLLYGMLEEDKAKNKKMKPGNWTEYDERTGVHRCKFKVLPEDEEHE